MRHHAEQLKLSPNDLSCTALALLLNVETNRGVAGQIGDGAILGLTKDGKLKEIVEPYEADDEQSTYTINRPSFEKYLSIDVVEQPEANPYVAFFVMTDGVSSDVLHSPEDERVKWVKKVDEKLRLSPSPLQAAAGMLNWLASYTIPGSWDDRIMVVITKEGANRWPR